MAPRGFGSSRNGVNGRNVRNLPPDQGGRNLGGGVLPFGGYRVGSSSSSGMLYEFPRCSPYASGGGNWGIRMRN